jgi:hypothetical protein
MDLDPNLELYQEMDLDPDLELDQDQKTSSSRSIFDKKFWILAYPRIHNTDREHAM